MSLGLLAINFLAQNTEKQVQLTGKVTELNLKDSSEKPINDVLIDVWADGIKIASMSSMKGGKYKTTLPYHRKYLIKYSGYQMVGKMVEIDAADFLEEARVLAFAMTIDVALFHNDNFMGLDFLSEVPVAKARYKHKLKTVEWDTKYTSSVNTRIRSVLIAYSK